MPDPIVQFNSWMEDAKRAGIDEPTAMALATADLQGLPSVRMVLLKHADEHGFVFYTNLESAKAAQLKVNPQAELCFYWGPLTRQVRVTGPVERTTDAEADAYFATRPRLSQIGAWASQQSRPMKGGYFELEQACAMVALRYPFGPVPRPPFWSGYRVLPERIEFWKQKPFRRHERVVYLRDGGGWREQWLFP
jgi:pyridoxamine 5'-phosphate oxidase